MGEGGPPRYTQGTKRTGVCVYVPVCVCQYVSARVRIGFMRCWLVQGFVVSSISSDTIFHICWCILKMACFPWRLAFCILKLNAAVQKLEDGCFLCGGPKARSGEPIMYRATDFYVGFAFRCEGCSKDVPGKFTLPICTYLLFRTLGNLHLQHSRRREYWKAGLNRHFWKFWASLRIGLFVASNQQVWVSGAVMPWS